MSTAPTKPRSRFPGFGRPTKITARSRKLKPADAPAMTFADLLEKRNRSPEVKRDVEGRKPFARVNILSPSDRVLLMELTVALRESTDTQRELGNLEPIDRSPKDEASTEVNEPTEEEVDESTDEEGDASGEEASGEDDVLENEQSASPDDVPEAG